MLVLWDDMIIEHLKAGDKLKIENGFVSSYRAVWRINFGRYAGMERTLIRRPNALRCRCSSPFAACLDFQFFCQPP